MIELFKLSKDDVGIIASRDEKFESIAFLKITGKLIDTTLPVFLESMTILTNKHLVNVIIDCSDVLLIGSSGWNAILKKMMLFKDSDGSIVLIRLKPFVFSIFKELNLESQIPHYRTYGDAVAYINQHDILPQPSETSQSHVELPHGVIEEEYLEKPTDSTARKSDDYADSEDQTDHSASNLQEIAASAEAAVEAETHTTEEETLDNPEQETFPQEMTSEESYPLNESRENDVYSGDITEEEMESTLPLPDSLATQTLETVEEEIIPPPRNLKPLESSGSDAASSSLRSLIEKTILELKISGYSTTALDNALQFNDNELQSAFNAYMNDLNTLRNLTERLKGLDHSSFAKETAVLQQFLHDPAQLENAKKQFNLLLELIEKRTHSAFNPLFEFSFDNFVKGECNKFAFDTAVLISQGDAVQAPVFIYGTNGTGKTHIVNAMGNRIMESSGRAVAYIPAEEFIISYENYSSVGALPLFREQYSGYDYIIIDDLQSFSTDQKAMIELKYLYEKSLSSGKKIIFTSTEAPHELHNFGKDFISRLKTAVTIKLSQPDGYTLTAIIKAKAISEGILLDDAVFPIITRESDGDIRTALGLLNTLKTYYMIYRQPLTAYTASEALGIVSPSTITDMTNIPDDELLSESQESFETETSALYDMNSVETPDATTDVAVLEVQPVEESVFTETNLDTFDSDMDNAEVEILAPILESATPEADDDSIENESTPLIETTNESELHVPHENTLIETTGTHNQSTLTAETQSSITSPEDETVPPVDSEISESHDEPVVETAAPMNNEQDSIADSEFSTSQSDENDFLQIDTAGTDDLWDDATDKTDDDPFKF